MRMQVEKLKRFLILNDAYNANPYSLQASLRALSHFKIDKIAVIADMLELGEEVIGYHEKVAPEIIKGNFKYCLTLGKYSHYLKSRLKHLGYRRAFHFNCHKDIAQFISKKARLNLEQDKRYLIFLKGSRKMELEKVTTYLK